MTWSFPSRDFQRALLGWYGQARRDLPWRAPPGKRADPYQVWLSEIMLQQTTVKAAIPYYHKFLGLWPSAETLAAASRDDVLAAWAGLGYYSRARNLHACAQDLARDGFPETASGLRKLPGIGAYTSAAIAAIAFGEAAAVVDGNVERVVARLFALETPLPAAKPLILKLATRLTPEEAPGDYAQAMMDLGATICTPRSPSCLVCAVRPFCKAASEGHSERFPVKRSRAAKPLRRAEAYVLLRTGAGGRQVLLRRRQDKGLLGGMLEVPSSVWIGGAAEEAGRARSEAAAFTRPLPDASWRLGAEVRHSFTHFNLALRILAATGIDPEAAAAAFGGRWERLDDLDGLALPAVMKKALYSGLAALD